MRNSSINNIIWWTLWGLGIGGGLFALKESFHHSYYLLMAMPLLTGSIAAAVSQLSHEYHKAAAQVKWMAISAPMALLVLAFLYVRAGAYGPFATGGTQRAFLNATFGMSVPEVERAVDRRLMPLDPPHELMGGVDEWLIEMVSPRHRVRAQYLLPDMELFGADCQARLDFFEGRLGHVELEFEKVPRDAMPALSARLVGELSKEYRPVTLAAPSDASSAAVVTSASGQTPQVFRKDDVEARLIQNHQDAFNDALAIDLTYLPLVRGKPLKADSQVF